MLKRDPASSWPFRCHAWEALYHVFAQSSGSQQLTWTSRDRISGSPNAGYEGLNSNASLLNSLPPSDELPGQLRKSPHITGPRLPLSAGWASVYRADLVRLSQLSLGFQLAGNRRAGITWGTDPPWSLIFQWSLASPAHMGHGRASNDENTAG